MNEEIDIIELLQRVKEGKAPKEIEINGRAYDYNDTWELKYAYSKNVNSIDVVWFENESITLSTKIKILDKPIIEELEKKTISDELITQTVFPTKEEFMNKINEIIKWINEQN